jgi:hypothetical protein
MSPVFIVLLRWSRPVGLALSVGLYLLALTMRLNLPAWPTQGGWFFNPLAWQLIMVVGFLSAELSRAGPSFGARIDRLVPLAWILVVLGATARLSVWSPDPFRVPEPKLLFLFDKTYMTPGRLLNCLAIVVVFRNTFPWIRMRARVLVDYLSGLGRNSLAVFCVGTLLSLTGQLVRFMAGGSLTIDTFIVLSGLLGMGITVWFVEWRERSQSLSQPSSSC